MLAAVATSPVRSASFTLAPKGAFSLARARAFLCAFGPLRGSVPASPDLVYAFGLDGTYEPVAVRLREEAGGGVRVDVEGSRDLEAVKRQVARIHALDVDARPWDELTARDPILGPILAERPGFRPVHFFSPYEAAVQAILGQRIAIAQAAAIRARASRAAGHALRAFGQDLHVFPEPARLVATDALPGVPDVKMERLRGVAAAALEGRLDATRLRAMPIADALEDLRRIPGVGPWSAEHILYRGAALADALPTIEPRVLRAASAGAGRTLAMHELARIAESWRPFRMWATVALVARHGFS